MKPILTGVKIELPSNAILTFEIQTSEQRVDPDTNNVSNVTKPVNLKASITELGDKTSDVEQPGLDTRYRNVRGYVLDKIPTGVLLKGSIPCQINGEVGTLHFTERFTPFTTEITKMLGTPIQGSFQTEGGGN